MIRAVIFDLDNCLSAADEPGKEFLEPVFDAMPDIVFFVKDAQARYALVNRALASRCGLKDKLGLLGKTAEEVFPQRFGRIYTAQDQSIIAHPDW